MINELSSYVDSHEINKFINSVIFINLAAINSYIFLIIVFKFHILTTFFTYHCMFMKLLVTYWTINRRLRSRKRAQHFARQ